MTFAALKIVEGDTGVQNFEVAPQGKLGDNQLAFLRDRMRTNGVNIFDHMERNRTTRIKE